MLAQPQRFPCAGAVGTMSTKGGMREQRIQRYRPINPLPLFKGFFSYLLRSPRCPYRCYVGESRGRLRTERDGARFRLGSEHRPPQFGREKRRCPKPRPDHTLGGVTAETTAPLVIRKRLSDSGNHLDPTASSISCLVRSSFPIGVTVVPSMRRVGVESTPLSFAALSVARSASSYWFF